MRLTLAIHPISEMISGDSTYLDGTRLQINVEELGRHLLEDRRLQSVDLEIVSPNESCRAGYVFDILEPRAKGPDSGIDFPGVLGPFTSAGQGTTHVLRGAAVTVLDGGQPGGEIKYSSGRGGVSKILEMRGPAAQASPYSSLHHLVVVPHPYPGVERHAVLNAIRVASLKAAVYLARTAIGQSPSTTELFELEGPLIKGREGLPRIAYIGQIHGHQHGTEVDEHILYGSNTRGTMPVPLHPNEWLDGAVLISYSWGARGLETYFHQNHPIITELYKRHQAKELTFVGTIATTSSDLGADLSRNCMVAAQLAKWNLGADGVILTKYAGGAPHADMFETARLCESLAIKTIVLVSDSASDRRAESASLMSIPEVDAVVSLSEGGDLIWQVPEVERTIGGNPEVAMELALPQELQAAIICRIINSQGASRLHSILY